jgi:hypothetical protein
MAYDTVLRLLRNVPLNAAQQKAVEDKLAVLKARLQAAGQ